MSTRNPVDDAIGTFIVNVTSVIAFPTTILTFLVDVAMDYGFQSNYAFVRHTGF